MTRNNIIGVPTITDIEEAYERINGQVKRTPVLSSESINRILGAQIFFKCENFQKVGAFKFRGASNAVLSLSEQEASKGVATHSSGNHAAALALAAALRGIPAHVVMPNNSPLIKRRAVEGYGARITYCNPTQQDREETLAKVQMRTGSAFVHPYDNTRVICGQGTAAMELLQEVNNLNTVIVPIGGGGLMSGTTIYVKGASSAIKVFGAEPRNADDAFRSLRDNTLHPSVNPATIADGLLTSLSPLTFKIVAGLSNGILTVSENDIVDAMRMIWERMKIIVEPSAAVPLAAVMANPDKFKDQRIGIILTGGNVDLDKLPFGKSLATL